jgi:hypothetical protein
VIRRRWLWGLALLGLLVAGALLLWPGTESERTSPSTSTTAAGAAYVRRETRPTLDPARFVGKARLAHQVAREIPDVLDRLYCYCECDKHRGHKSLLSCYTDGHAPT